MDDHSVAYVALDTSKLRNAVAIAEAGRNGEIRYLGEIDNAPAATAKLARRLARKHAALTFWSRSRPATGCIGRSRASVTTASWWRRR